MILAISEPAALSLHSVTMERIDAQKVKAGNYDIRYRDLGNGTLSRSEAFELTETPTSNGTQFSNITMTLYKVQHGNMQTHRLSEAEF